MLFFGYQNGNIDLINANNNVCNWKRPLYSGEYSEAQRLRQLNSAIQNTFYEQCAAGENALMDRIQTISRGTELLITDLERLAEKKRHIVEVKVPIGFHEVERYEPFLY